MCLLFSLSASWTLQIRTPRTSLLLPWLWYGTQKIPLLGSQSKRLRVFCHVVFWKHKIFSSISKFHLSSTSSFFIDALVDLFPSDNDTKFPSSSDQSSPPVSTMPGDTAVEEPSLSTLLNPLVLAVQVRNPLLDFMISTIFSLFYPCMNPVPIKGHAPF